MNPVSLFISYSHRDEQFREELTKHLTPLKRAGFIEAWHDRCLRPGAKWAAEIDRNIEEADIILLLVSADFVASNYCYEKEMARALDRHAAGAAVVIPVVIRSVAWEHTPLAELQALPRDALPVEEWKYRDRAWADVVRGVLEVSNGSYGQSNTLRAASREARSEIGLPPETTAYMAALDKGDKTPENLVKTWEDTQKIGMTFPVLATLIAEYRRDKEALELLKRKQYEDSIAIVESKMPIEFTTFIVGLIHIENLEERVKVRTKELRIFLEVAEARKKASSASLQSELNPQSLGLSATSFEHCQRLLSSEMDEHANAVQAAATIRKHVHEAISKPIRKISDQEDSA